MKAEFDQPKKNEPTTVIRKEYEGIKQSRLSNNDQNDKHLFAVYVKHHPPSFLDGRYINYVNYYIRETEE